MKKGIKKFKTAHQNTPKGALPIVRLISKEHSIYPMIFDENGKKRPSEQIEAIQQAIISAQQSPESKKSLVISPEGEATLEVPMTDEVVGALVEGSAPERGLEIPPHLLTFNDIEGREDDIIDTRKYYTQKPSGVGK